MINPAQRLRILLAALVAPLVVILAALVITFSIASHSVGTIAVHWNAAGIPDAFGSPFTFPILIAAVCLPLTALLGGIVVLASHRGPMTIILKLISVTGLWISVWLGVALSWSLSEQQATASAASASLTPLPVGLGVATVIAAAAWFLLPQAQKTSRGGGTPVAPVALGAQERASWIRSTSASVGLIWVFVGSSVLLTALAVVSIIQTGGRLWPMSFVPVLLVLVMLSNFAWTVRVDARGVRIRSTLGIPTITVPLTNIESADVIDVQAMAQYGGYGIRWALNGRVGVIVRSGEALQILRHKGLSIVVTVDDAASAAALINGLVQRNRAAVS